MKTIDRLLQRWRISKGQTLRCAPGARLLDIGCADGELFRRIHNVGEGVGVDPDLPARTVPLPNATLIKGLFPRALPDDRPFDVITLLAVLEHVPAAAQEALALDCARHLKPGGYLVVTVPSPFVDYILAVLKSVRPHSWHARLEQHYGYDPGQTAVLFAVCGGMDLINGPRQRAGTQQFVRVQEARALIFNLPIALFSPRTTPHCH